MSSRHTVSHPQTRPDRLGSMELDDLSRWVRGSGLEVVLITLGAVLLARFVRWTTGRLLASAASKNPDGRDRDIAAAEAVKHKAALWQVAEWSGVFVVYLVAALLVVERLNIPVTSLVAPATLAAAAIGFGAQRLVHDLISGFFIFAERQYGYGDVVRVAQPGEPSGVSGAVEEVTLRTTKLRTDSGELIVIPNGEIRQVTNLSKEWGRVVLDLPLATDADVAQASEILRGIGIELLEDDEWAPLLLDTPTVMGIERFGVGFIHLRFVARTLPGKQWDVGRELRGRIAEAFRDAGIPVAGPLVADARPAGG